MSKEAEYAKLQALQEEKKDIEQKNLLLSSDTSFDMTSILTDYKRCNEDEVRDMKLFLDEKSATVQAQRNELGRFVTLRQVLLTFFTETGIRRSIVNSLKLIPH